MPKERSLGVFSEALNILEADLNFTTSRKMFKNKSIGFQGRKGWTGLIGELLAEYRTDILLYPVVNTLNAYGVLSYLHGIDVHTLGLMTNVDAGNEKREWSMFVLLFKHSLWQGVLGLSSLYIFTLFVHQFCFDCDMKFEYASVSESFSTG